MAITQQRLKEVINYEPDTGIFKWKQQLATKSKPGQPVGTPQGAAGYLRIQIDGRRYMSHHLAWLYVYGTLPIGEIDHINRNTSDNSISNLRLATKSENSFNRKESCGCCWSKIKGKWRAYIMVRGTNNHLGWFDTEQEARNARSIAEEKYYPNFKRYDGGTECLQ